MFFIWIFFNCTYIYCVIFNNILSFYSMVNSLIKLLFVFVFLGVSPLLASGSFENDGELSKHSSSPHLSSDDASLLDSDSDYDFSPPQLDIYQTEKHQVRYQIRSDLEMFEIESKKIESKLRHPVFCVGTGTSVQAMHFSGKHPHMTIVEENDTTLDTDVRMKPHFWTNAWQISEKKEEIQERGPFGLVYFAHVGAGFPKNPQEALNTYFDILKPGGLFLYKSFVYLKEAFTQEVFFKEASPKYPTFKKFKRHYKKALRRAGLRHTKIMIRDEPLFGYMAPLASLMIYAKKSRRERT